MRVRIKNKLLYIDYYKETKIIDLNVFSNLEKLFESDIGIKLNKNSNDLSTINKIEKVLSKGLNYLGINPLKKTIEYLGNSKISVKIESFEKKQKELWDYLVRFLPEDIIESIFLFSLNTPKEDDEEEKLDNKEPKENAFIYSEIPKVEMNWDEEVDCKNLGKWKDLKAKPMDVSTIEAIERSLNENS